MKGISPVVSMVLLIALGVIVSVGIFYWSAGFAVQQQIPETDVIDISVTAVDVSAGTYLVTNVDTEYFTASVLHTNNGTLTEDCTFVGAPVTVASGESVQCTIAGATKPTGEITFYHDLLGPATVVVG